jgi:hypothetical protein
MYHQGEDPTLEPLGSNPYTIGRHGCIHANNLVKVTNLDQSLGCIRTIMEAFGRYDEIHEEYAHVSETNPHDDDNFFKGEETIDERMEMLLEAETPLFEACGQSKNSRLSSVLMFHACTLHQMTNIFQNELSRLLGCEILTKNNLMPKSKYEARKLVSSLGLNYTSIHACEPRCILYCKENKDLLMYPICKASQYVEGSEIIPWKVLRHFLLIPHLKKLNLCNDMQKIHQKMAWFGLWLIQRYGNTLMQCG